MEPDPQRRRMLWIEVAVVVGLFTIPEIWLGITAFLYPRSASPTVGWTTDVHRVLDEFGVIAVVLFIAWSSGDPMKEFGFRKVVWWKFSTLALAGLAAGMAASYGISSMFAHSAPAYFHETAARFAANVPRTPRTFPLQAGRVGTFCLGAFLEEFVTRGYLLYRLNELLNRPWLGLFVSSVLFAAYHIYQGPIATLSIFVIGLIFGTIVLVSRSIWPSTLAHAALNTLHLFLRFHL